MNADVIGGKLLVGNNLIIENTNDQGIMQFKVDSTGAWLNNATMVFQQDGGGKILMDPKYGIVAGTQSIFDTDGTTVKPGFIDENGNIIRDEDGMPKDSNFFLDLRDGTAYFRGKVYAEEGRFRGDVYADNFYFNDGDDVRTLINDAGEVDFSKMKRIDLGGIVLDGETGNINFTGAGSITWGDNTPVKYQFGTSSSGPWHTTMAANDKYRRDSLDGGTTWGDPYQFRGTDGQNGSDANVTRSNIEKALQKASTTSSSYIGVDSVGSPEIYGGKIYGTQIYSNEFNVYPIEDSTGSFNLYGKYGTRSFNMFQLSYYVNYPEAPRVAFESPGGAYASWSFDKTNFFGDISFTGADKVNFTGTEVIGLYATFA